MRMLVSRPALAVSSSLASRAAVLLLLTFGGSADATEAMAAAGPCAPEAIELDRGERRRVVVCAAGLPESPVLQTPAGVAVRYQQRLRHCAIGDRRPGLQLILEADAKAVGGKLQWSAGAGASAGANAGANTSTAAGADARVAGDPGQNCPSIPVSVPDRVLLPAVRLVGGDDDALELRLEAPQGWTLPADCASALRFPPGPGRQLTLRADGRVRCKPGQAAVDVRSLDARSAPARIVVTGLRAPDGTLREGVVHANPPEPAWTSGMRESDARYATVDGVRTRYFEKGRGEALVLVHGGQPSSMDGNAWDWQQNFDGLAERFHVYAFDRIGQGYTANPDNLDEYADYYPRVVRHVLAFMDAMDIERAHLVGHSQGSWPVTRIAVDHPDRVRSLTLVDGTMVAPSRDGGSAIRFYLYLTQDLHPKTGETVESARRGMEFFSFTHNNITDQRVERLVTMTKQPKYAESQAWFAKSGMSPAHPAFRALKSQIVADLEGGALRMPVLIVWGQNDPEGSLPSGLELFRMIGPSSERARLHVFGRSGHMSFVEYPGEFNRLLIDFALDGR